MVLAQKKTGNSLCTHRLEVSSARCQLVVSFLCLLGLTSVSTEVFSGVLEEMRRIIISFSGGRHSKFDMSKSVTELRDLLCVGKSHKFAVPQLSMIMQIELLRPATTKSYK